MSEKQAGHANQKHTPGPWEVHELADGPSKTIGPLGVFVAQTIGGNDTANARLIAAAPDLLAACKETLQCCDAINQDDADLLPSDTISQIEAAIAKAEG